MEVYMPATIQYSRQGRHAPQEPAIAQLDINDIRNRVDEVLNRLSAQLIGRVSDVKADALDSKRDVATQDLQNKVASFGQIAAGLAIIDSACLPAAGAGYGSTVTVRDVRTNQVDQYTLMVGSLVDIETQQVSLASPIGQALLGKCEGDEIVVTAPHRRARMLVTKVVTLMDKLEENETHAP
jgi:transcription elongation GreA/GreB family factor